MLTMEQVVGVLASAGLGTAGTNLFAYKMPDSVVNGVVALNPLAGEVIDHELGGFGRDAFQIIIRCSQIPAGRLRATQVANALTWQAPRTLPAIGDIAAITLLYCRPRHRPIFFPRDAADLIEMSINFDYAGYLNNS